MKIVFYASDKPREHMLAKALVDGARVHGDELELRRTADYGEDDQGRENRWPGPSPDTEVACVFGVKGRSRVILRDHLEMAISTLFLDKGYFRQTGEGGHTEYSRISVNGADPLAYMMRVARPTDRWERLGLELRPRSKSGGNVLICTSSQKYCDFHKLGDATGHAKDLVARVRKQTARPIVYRPKPSWHSAVPIVGAHFSHGGTKIGEALRGAHCVLTHGATAAMDAILAGVPAIVLGNGIARPVSGTELEQVDDPPWFRDRPRGEWAAAMAYTQWTTAELRSGEAWAELRAEIEWQRAAGVSL